MPVPKSENMSKGQRTREMIVHNATRLFSEEGFRATSLREIAAACNMTHPGLLYHFANKEVLLLAVLERRDELDLRMFRRSNPGIDDGLEGLRGLVALARQNSSTPGLVELFTTLSAEATARDHPAHEYFVQRYRRIRLGTAHTLKRTREEGYLRAEVDIDDTSHELTALQDGLQVQWLLDPENVDVGALLERRINQLLLVSL